MIVGLPLDHYEAINLLEALKVAPDTGDWHGQVWWKLEGLLRLTRADNVSVPTLPNISADHQLERIRQGG